MNADERKALEIVSLLYQLVSDTRKRAFDLLGVEDDLPQRAAGRIQRRHRVAGLVPAR